MIHKTEGIVINHIKYKESSIIVRIFTKDFGLQSYIVNGVRSKTAKTKMALFQPLTILDLVVYKNDRKSIQRISELKALHPFRSIPFAMKKTTMAIFLAEVFSKVLKEEENEDLFLYLKTFIHHLDEQETGVERTHLILLVQLMNFLGFHPQSFQELNDQIRNSAFDLKGYPLELAEEKLFQDLMEDPRNCEITSHSTRMKMLQWLLFYYSLHIEGFQQLKSLNVLTEVLH